MASSSTAASIEDDAAATSSGLAPWDKVYSCHSGCFYSMCCSPCAMVEVAEFLEDKEALDKFGCCGQTLAECATFIWFPFAICLCRSWMLPCFHSDYANRLGAKLGKDMDTLGPCPDSSCCGAKCTMVLPCSEPCTLSMLYGEMKRVRDGPTTLDSIVPMERA